MLRKYLLTILTFSLSLFGYGQSISMQVSLKGNTCEYSSVRFEASVNSKNPYICRWWKIGELRDHLLTVNGRIYEIPVLHLSDSGSYYCTVTETESGLEIMSDTLHMDVSPLIVNLPVGIPAIGERDELLVPATDQSGNLIDSRYLCWSYGSLTQWSSGSQTQLPSGSGGNPFRLKGTSSDMLLKVRYDRGNCIGYDSLHMRVKSSRYYWGGSDDGYARVSSAFRLELNEPVHRTYCEGEILRFKITAISDGGSSSFQYQWWHILGGHNLPVSKDTVFRLSPARIADAGAYYCEVRDENGFTVLSDTQYINLIPLHIRVNPGIQYAGEGETVRVTAFNAQGDTLAGDSVLWTVNSLPVSSSSSDRSLNVLAASEDLNVRALYTNIRGCSASDSMTVITKAGKLSLGGVEDGFAKVGAGFIVERLFPSGVIEEYCLDGEVPFKAQVTGENNANYRFRWWKIGRPSNRLVAERDSFSLSGLTDADAGLYFCEARDANGSTAFSDTLLLTRHSVDLPGTYYATAGEQVTFCVVNAKGETMTTPITWSERMEGDAVYYPLPSTDNPLHYAISTGTTIKVTSNFRPGCSASDTTSVIVRNNSLFGGSNGDGFDQTLVPPSIIRPFLPAQICFPGDTASLQVYAEGSDLRYTWQMLDPLSGQYITVPVEVLENTALTSLLQFRNLPVDYNRTIRCMVSNSLDTVYSREVKLYGHHRLQAAIIPDVVRFGEETSASVSVRLLHGTAPWNYRYESPRGVSRQRSGITDSTSLFTVSDLGIYRLTYLSDALGCETIDSLPDVEVTTYKIPKITISGGGEICAGTNVNLLLSIREGIGPWEITLNCDGFAADNLNISWPLKITNRDTSLWFSILQSGVYTIDTVVDLNNGGKRWGGTASGTASFLVRESDNVRFTPLNDNHVGICRPLDLFALLQPLVNHMPDQAGSFFVDGIPISGYWQPMRGQHSVRYIQQPNSLGCSGDAEITLVGDPPAEVSLQLPSRDVCSGAEGELHTIASGNGASFTLVRERIDRETKSVVRTISVVHTAAYSEAVRFNDSDSCLVYSVQDISDRHGCAPAGTPLISDTVYSRILPALLIQARYPDLPDTEWIGMASGDTLHTWGDAAGLQILPGKGITPFTIECERLPYFSGGVCSISDAGTYIFGIRDLYCSDPFAGSLTIHQMPALYLRLKILLEGFNTIGDSRDISIALCRNGRIVARGAGKVFGDGTVTDINGSSILSTKSFVSEEPLTDGTYEILVCSDGYLSVRSKKGYVLSGDTHTSPFVDFTDGDNVFTCGDDLSLHMTWSGNRDGKDIWSLSTVEGNGNDLISVRDANVTLTEPVRFSTGGDETGRTKKNRDKHGQSIE